MSIPSPVPADSQLARKARALVRYGPGFAIEVAIFWVMLEAFQQLNYGGRVINGLQQGILLVLSGEALFFRSRALLGYAGLVFLFFFLFVVAYEEPALTRKFGEEYERYCDRVPRWIPRLSKNLER